MKKIIIVFLCVFASLGVQGQNIFGAWERNFTTDKGIKLKTVIIFSEGYFVQTTYSAVNGKFISTKGGAWILEGDSMTEKLEFNTNNTELVGKDLNYKVIISDTVFEIVDKEIKFNRIDNGLPGALQGAWLMSGRIRNGETQLRDTSKPRKTMKILSGTRFQWVAYNTETKQFMGTGGGTYTTIDGEYTENIKFFSKDDTRVGASLQFNYSLKDGNWHHSGLSSKGTPIYEIWSLRS
ncbi:membrane or secreted protein [Lutibacter sp. A80]|uniref:membrane or secreted protein n=1 Tax=Lutibacter sp. A80 TaxID=2918453 RepID=UPI001F053313|nr:membrane or secreted protein [Lutibacter sp. A80]UMB59278.1 membrane or secreted protein [Lutibacter sp. A80]